MGRHEVASFVPPLKALFDERAKYPVFLVRAVEKSANVTVLTENALGASHGTAIYRHFYLLPLMACSGPAGRSA
jgi:hypothetical protein